MSYFGDVSLSLSLSICVYIYSYHSLHNYTLTSSLYVPHIMMYVSVLLLFLTPRNKVNTFLMKVVSQVCVFVLGFRHSVILCLPDKHHRPDQQTMARNVLWVTDGLFGHFRLP